MGASEDAARLPIARWHAEMERHLKDSGVSYTVLRANTFMQNYLYSLTHTYVHALFGTGGEGRCSVVDARDVAAVATAVLLDPGHAGKVYDVTGPQALTLAQVAATISKVTGRHLRYVTMSDAELAAGYHYGGLPGRLADELVAADEPPSAGVPLRSDARCRTGDGPEARDLRGVRSRVRAATAGRK